MDTLSDAELAHSLQLQFDTENVNQIDSKPPEQNGRRRSGPMGIVDHRWELIDPHPDIRALFLQFNGQFFWGRLEGIEVKWSPRMTLCAGLCCYEGYGGLCSVRLSQPLLKLRPRKDLVETLLHEMIHAYLFVTQNNKDHDGHGPEFCKHMNRINSETGTNISIYHTFHDEVDLYRQHWWRCNGSCKERKPYYGYVKRAMNRAPSSRDTWWAEHQRTCGGTFTKIKEPEGYGQKKSGKKKSNEENVNATDSGNGKGKSADDGADIRNFIPFSGKGQTIGGSSLGAPASSSSSSMNSKGPSNTGTNPKSKLPKPVNDLKTSAGDKVSKSDISSYFSKNIKPSDKPLVPSERIRPGSLTGNQFGSAKGGESSSGVSKKPRFTPVVATARGRVLSSSNDHCLSVDNDISEKESSASSPHKTKKKFIPVVSAVGRKETVLGADKVGKSLPVGSISHRDHQIDILRGESLTASASQTSQPTLDKTKTDGSSSRHHLKQGVCQPVVKSDSSSGKQSSKKRARLIDLQTMFDSDSDDEQSLPKSSKCPRYSEDDGDNALVVDNGIPKRNSAGSNKENSYAVDDHWSDEVIPVLDDSEDDSADTVGDDKVTSGIWKDLSHRSSFSSTNTPPSGNRRFGRVPPPLWGRSQKTSKGIGQSVPPTSSFSEHPWQTAARQGGSKEFSGMKDSSVIHPAPVEEGSPAGPKTVPCPVCHLQIEEKKINYHLDTCLTYNCDALFSP